jgi:hypothetical protein
MCHEKESAMKLGVFRFTLFIFLAAVIFAPLHAQELKFDNEALAKFGTKTFRMVALSGSPDKPEVESGAMTLSVKLEPDGLSLVSQTKMLAPNGKDFVKFDYDCKCSTDGRLAIQSLTNKVERSDGLVMHEATGTVEKEQFKYTFSSGGRGRTLEEPISKETMIDFSVFFLVTQFPREAGKSWVFESVLPSPTNVVRKPDKQTITCNGIDESASSPERKLFRFTKVETSNSFEVIYWVDEQGVLRRVQLSPRNRLELVE